MKCIECTNYLPTEYGGPDCNYGGDISKPEEDKYCLDIENLEESNETTTTKT